MKPIITSNLDIKIKYGELIPRQKPLFKGEGKIIFIKGENKAYAWIKEKKLVNIFTNTYKEVGLPIKLGEISKNAIKIITNSPIPKDGYYNIVEEREEIPYKVFCDNPNFKGWKTRRKYSDVKRKIRVIINGCRY